MFVFLSKFLPQLVYPLGLALLLLAGTLILRALGRQPRWQTRLLVAAFVLLAVGGNRWVSFTLARSLEWQYPTLSTKNPPTADVIVVLGGATESAQAPRTGVEVNSAGDRVLYAARLYHANAAPTILLSGGNITWLEGRTTTPAAEMAELLLELGVPQSAMVLQDASENTAGDAEFSAQILRQRGAQRVLLVTSAMHMPRSMALFRHLGIDVIAAPTDFTVTESGWKALFSPDAPSLLVNLLPNTSSLSLTTNVLKEYLGLIVYRLRGWL